MRFITSEIEGWNLISSGHGGGHTMGISCQVIDTAWNNRVISVFRSEDETGNVGRRRELVRRKAADLAAVLNGSS